MIQGIPTLFDGTVAYRQRTRLGVGDAAQDWVIDFRWNARTETWHMSILDLNSTPVLTGQAIVCGLNLLGRAVGGPGGFIFALSSDGGLEPPGLTELGEGARVQLFYSDDGQL